MLYRKKDGDNVVVVGVFVDDLLATATSAEAEAADRFFVSLKPLSIQGFWTCVEFLGMRVSLDSDGVYVLVQRYEGAP